MHPRCRRPRSHPLPASAAPMSTASCKECPDEGSGQAALRAATSTVISRSGDARADCAAASMASRSRPWRAVTAAKVGGILVNENPPAGSNPTPALRHVVAAAGRRQSAYRMRRGHRGGLSAAPRPVARVTLSSLCENFASQMGACVVTGVGRFGMSLAGSCHHCAGEQFTRISRPASLLATQPRLTLRPTSTIPGFRVLSARR